MFPCRTNSTSLFSKPPKKPASPPKNFSATSFEKSSATFPPPSKEARRRKNATIFISRQISSTKNKISLITLIACAAAGTAFAEDTEKVYRQDSGTKTNSADKVYVGNDEWGADAKDLGERYFADLWMKYGDPENAGTRSFTWDPERKAFLVYTEIDEGDTMKEFMSYDFAFALTGTAQFTNAADTTMTFGFNGVPPTSGEFHDEEKNEWSYLDVGNEVLLAGSSKFTNAGTIRFKSTTLAGDPAHTGYEVFLRDDAVFENTGTIATEPDDNYISYIGLNLFGNSKFVNAEGGTMERAELTLHGNATFENAGTIVVRESSRYDTDYVTLHENAKFVNTGTIEGGAIYGFKFYPGITGTEKVENRGTMDRANVEFAFELNSASETLSGVSATFENHGTIKALDDRDGWGDMEILTDFEFWGEDDLSFDEYCGSFQRNLEKSDLNVKNYGTIDLGRNGTVAVVGSGVKLTLAEGSRIVGETVSIGVAKGRRSENGYESVRLDNDVLNIVLTGRGGNDPMISGDLDLCNRIELGVSFAEDAVKKTKYELKIWDGELRFKEYYSESDYGSTGTLDAFDTTYIWSLDTATGVLTAKDVNIGEIVVDDPGAAVSPGENDVVTIPSDLEEFYGTISGSGQVDVSGSLTFTGDMSEHTGTTNIGEKGTFTVTGSDVKLGTGTFAVTGTLKLEVQGTFVFEAKTTGSGALEISSGATVSFSKSVGVKTLNVSDGATLKGGVKLTGGADAVLTIAGTLALDAAAGEKVALGTGKTVLAPTAKLRLDAAGGNAAGASFMAAGDAAPLENGGSVVIFENCRVLGDGSDARRAGRGKRRDLRRDERAFGSVAEKSLGADVVRGHERFELELRRLGARRLGEGSRESAARLRLQRRSRRTRLERSAAERAARGRRGNGALDSRPSFAEKLRGNDRDARRNVPRRRAQRRRAPRTAPARRRRGRGRPRAWTAIGNSSRRRR